jgi:hypothetical protein
MLSHPVFLSLVVTTPYYALLWRRPARQAALYTKSGKSLPVISHNCATAAAAHTNKTGAAATSFANYFCFM